MARVAKFERSAVVNQIRHVERLTENPSNEDINPERSGENYRLSPDRGMGMTSYDYYKHRLDELHVHNRSDVKTMAGWIATAPQDLPLEQEALFFQHTYDFLAERYHEENAISAVVHKDESGQPHLHFLFIPATEDLKHGGEKVSAKEVLDRQELRNFHPDWQRHLDEHAIDAQVITGVTKAQGGNRTVAEMKQERNMDYEYEYTRKLRF